jgi:cyclohexadieny/prephenate dehydrogenase
MATEAPDTRETPAPDAAAPAPFTPVDRLVLIGLGLIGSSVARSARRHGLAREIVGHARSAETRATALRLGLVDRVEEDPAAAVAGADMVMLCTPVSTYAALGRAIAPALAEGAIVTDAGSTKGSVIRDLAPVLPAHARLVPAHPIAGTEHSGPESGFAELFVGRFCIVTPVPGVDPSATERVVGLWQAMGMTVHEMTAEHHDRVLAITSHLPHLIAYCIVGTATDLEEQTREEVIKYSAGGFRDFTRIAASDPVMWRDVFLNNREAVLEIIQRFTEDLTALQRAIRWEEGETLERHFTRTRAIRRGVIAEKQA